MNEPEEGRRSQAPTTAVFIRVEETLLPASDLQATAFQLAQAPGPHGRLARLGLLAAALPAIGAATLVDRRLARRVDHLLWRGLSQDRIELLAREHHERFLAGRVRALGRELVARARQDGRRVVLVTTGLAAAATPLARTLGADDLVGNQLELQDGAATGRILEGRGEGWAEGYALRHGLVLAACLAYGADVEDEPLLRAVGHPCAVNPDRRLRRVAEERGWPVLISS